MHDVVVQGQLMSMAIMHFLVYDDGLIFILRDSSEKITIQRYTYVISLSEGCRLFCRINITVARNAEHSGRTYPLMK